MGTMTKEKDTSMYFKLTLLAFIVQMFGQNLLLVLVKVQICHDILLATCSSLLWINL